MDHSIYGIESLRILSHASEIQLKFQQRLEFYVKKQKGIKTRKLTYLRPKMKLYEIDL